MIKVTFKRCQISWNVKLKFKFLFSLIQNQLLPRQGTFNWRASSYPDFNQNYFLLKRMFDFFDNRDKSRKPGFLRGKIYTSCISMVLLDHFAIKQKQHFSLSLSRSPISSHFLANTIKNFHIFIGNISLVLHFLKDS